jgi:hypothetical protein
MKSREQLRSIYNGMSDAVFIHDPMDGTILDANETAVESYSYYRLTNSALCAYPISVRIMTDASQEQALVSDPACSPR